MRNLSYRLLKPRRLVPGATIAFVAPSGPVGDGGRPGRDAVLRARANLESLGYRVVLGEHVFDAKGYLAGDDASRAEDLNRVIRRADVDAVFCVRGGYGSSRILGLVDWEAVRASRKPIMGYSDVTALCIAVYQKARLIAFHGPMPAPDLSWTGPISEYNVKAMLRALSSGEALGEAALPAGRRMVSLVPGKAEGRLVGGNLSVLCSLMGTPYEIDSSGKILFLEDVDEEPYRVDRMLNQLYLSGKLGKAAGLIFGDFTESRAGQAKAEAEAAFAGAEIFEVLAEYAARSGRPCVAGLPCGHGAHKLTLPIGARARIDADDARLFILEPATT